MARGGFTSVPPAREFEARAPRILSSLVREMILAGVHVPAASLRAHQGDLEGRPVSIEELCEGLAQAVGSLGPALPVSLPLCIWDRIEERDRRIEGRSSASDGGRQVTAVIAPGLECRISAASGTCTVSPEALALIPEPLADESGVYKGQSDWARVAVAFPEFFSTRKLVVAYAVARDWFPGHLKRFSQQLEHPSRSGLPIPA